MIFSGGMAGCVAKTVVAPLNRVTILMQVQSMNPQKFVHKSLWRSLREIHMQEGLRGFWIGNGTMIVHRFPYTGLTFTVNATAKLHLEKYPCVPQQLRSFFAASSSACIAVLATYPLDVVRTRLSTQLSAKHYNGILDALCKIGREEGCAGLYRGLTMSCCSTVPTIGFNFAVYDQFIHLYRGLPAPQYVHTLLAGATAGALASTLFFPVDLLRRQMQLVGARGGKHVYCTVLDAIVHVYRSGYNSYQKSPCRLVWGIREFFRGLLPELIKVIPNNAIMFTVQSSLLRGLGLAET